MEIRRDFYLDKLIKRKTNGLIKVITGICRCGKSYLLNNLFYHHLLDSGVDADHIIRFAFDSADDLYLIGESLIQIEKKKRGVDPENSWHIYVPRLLMKACIICCLMKFRCWIALKLF